MKRNLACWAIALGLVLSVAGLAIAQDSTTTQQQTTTTTTTTNDDSAPPAQSTDTMAAPNATPDTTTPNSTMSDKDSAMTPSQDATSASTDKGSDVRTVTGCLRAGDNSKEYELRGNDGSSWELRSDAVDLASHVGHTVTVTGAVRNPDMHNMKEDAKKAAAEHGMGSGNEHGHLTVTNVTMVSDSCTR
jgi:cytoskeletal protein RodZ